MNRFRSEDYVFYQGEKFQVEFFYTEKGEMPAKKYFDDSDRQVQIKLLALVKYMAEHGRLFDETKFRLVDKKDKIYEFKPFHERFLNFFFEGKKIVITNVYRKKSRSVDGRELLKAINFKRDYEIRIKEGNYYEAQ